MSFSYTLLAFRRTIREPLLTAAGTVDAGKAWVHLGTTFHTRNRLLRLCLGHRDALLSEIRTLGFQAPSRQRPAVQLVELS